MLRRKYFISFDFLVQAAFWLFSLGFVIYISTISYNWETALLRSSLVFICHLANFYVCYSLLIPRYYEKKKYALTFGWLLIFILIITPVRYYIEQQFATVPAPLGYRFAGRMGMTGMILFSELSIVLISSLLKLAVSNEKTKSKMAELEKLQLETELRFLKTQMSPHFLFNTINNIYSLVLIKSDNAPEALMKLSNLLRYLLYDSHERVHITKEADAIQAFIELYQLKSEWKQNITFVYNIENETTVIEPLLLLPLVENAVKHSGLGISTSAMVRINITEQNSNIQITIQNTKAIKPVQLEDGGIGLVNIQKRLQLAYPEKYKLNIDDEENLFTLTLNITTQ